MMKYAEGHYFYYYYYSLYIYFFTLIILNSSTQVLLLLYKCPKAIIFIYDTSIVYILWRYRLNKANYSF